MSWKAPNPDLNIENENVLIRPLQYPADAQSLFDVASIAANGGENIFEYTLGTGPFETMDQMEAYLKKRSEGMDVICYVVFSKRLNRLVGSLSLMRIVPEHGSIEIGSIWYGNLAQRSEVNTNAMFLMFTYVFEELHYRRLEWKCNNENVKSKEAALRLGFTFEGIFRQHFWDKGRNRDTAWFSIIDNEWPQVKQLFLTKLIRN